MRAPGRCVRVVVDVTAGALDDDAAAALADADVVEDDRSEE